MRAILQTTDKQFSLLLFISFVFSAMKAWQDAKDQQFASETISDILQKSKRLYEDINSMSITINTLNKDINNTIVSSSSKLNENIIKAKIELNASVGQSYAELQSLDISVDDLTRRMSVLLAQIQNKQNNLLLQQKATDRGIRTRFDEQSAQVRSADVMNYSIQSFGTPQIYGTPLDYPFFVPNHYSPGVGTSIGLHR